MTGSGNVGVAGNIDSGSDVAVRSEAGSVALGGNVTASGAVDAAASGGNVGLSGARIEGASVRASATEGSVTVSGGVSSTEGGIAISASDSSAADGAGDITFKQGSSLASASTVDLEARNGSVTVEGSGAENDSSVRAQGDVTVATRESGDISVKVGHIMQRMAADMQVIAITHLPQIAARATQHYKVYKSDEGEKTASKIKMLDNDGRRYELAVMLSAEPPSAAALQTATELMQM